jgi:hypothetical protein
MARCLHCHPHQVTIIAVKPQDTKCGLELSPQMQQWIPRILETVLREIRR